MAKPTLTPSSNTSVSKLPITGSPGDVAAVLPFGIYSGNTDFLSGAAEQVAYTYKKLGGDVLDIELKAESVYSNYEEAVLEYSYLINSHQAKYVMSDILGATTGTFDHDGSLKTLEEVINHYAKGGENNENKDKRVVPFKLNDEEKLELMAFLQSLTDSSFITR